MRYLVSMSGRVVKRAFKYRFYPTDEQAARAEPDVRVRPEGVQPGVGGPHRRRGRAAAAGQLQRRPRRCSPRGRRPRSWRSCQRGVVRAVAAGAAAPARRVRGLLRQAREVPDVQVARSVAGVGGVHPLARSAGATGELTLAKMAEPLDIVWSRPLPEGAEPSHGDRVAATRPGAGIVSLLCEVTVHDGPATDAVVGVDAGITSCSPCPPARRSPTRGTSARDRAAAGPAQRQPGPQGKGSANRAKARRRWPGCTPGSPTGAATTCTS